MKSKRLCAVVLFLLVFLCAAFSDGQQEPPEPPQTTVFNGIAVTAPAKVKSIDILVGELPMKTGFQVGVPVQQDGLTIWPLMNLDIYAKPPARLGIKKISKFDPDITVTIPYSAIEKLTGLSSERIKQLDIYFYVEGQWVPAKRSGDIRFYKNQNDTFSFSVDSWPIDDRMMGCG